MLYEILPVQGHRVINFISLDVMHVTCLSRYYIDIKIYFFYHLGQPSDGPIGISVALSPATATPTISKSMITNASFRTKKLPGMFLYCVYIYYKLLIFLRRHVKKSRFDKREE